MPQYAQCHKMPRYAQFHNMPQRHKNAIKVIKNSREYELFALNLHSN